MDFKLKVDIIPSPLSMKIHIITYDLDGDMFDVNNNLAGNESLS